MNLSRHERASRASSARRRFDLRPKISYFCFNLIRTTIINAHNIYYM